MTSIIGGGVYVPRYRITAETIADAWGRFQAAGISEKRVAGADEDALTMGAAAARRAIDAAGTEAGSIGTIAFATTTPPLAEGELAPRLSAFLGVDDAVTRTLSGSTRAGTQALLAAASAGATNDAAFPALVVAADSPKGEPNSPVEHAAGAGAVALVLDEAQTGGATLSGRAEYSADYPGTRFRQAGDDVVEKLGITSYDRQAYRECVTGAVDRLDTASDLDDVDAVALQAPNGTLPGRAARALDVDAAVRTVAEERGDLGAASALAALARVLDQDGERALAVGYGSGAAADAVLVDGRAPVVSNADRESERIDYPTYLRLRGELSSDPPAGGGAQVSVPSWRRQRGARYRLEAGSCPNCATLAFPAEGACPGCQELVEFDPVRLSHTGAVETTTGVSAGGAPPEFAQQAERGGEFGVAIVALPPEEESSAESDRTASVPMQVTDTDPATVDAGDAVEAVVRRIYTQEGVTRYGRKVRPVEQT